MKELEKLRKEITKIDDELITLLSKRFEYVEQIGSYKKEYNMPIVDPEREATMLEGLGRKATQHGLSIELIEKIWSAIFTYSYTKEK